MLFYFHKECSPGFFAENCSRQCLYPYYGKKCNGMCSCDNITCNFMDGCDKGGYICLIYKLYNSGKGSTQYLNLKLKEVYVIEI